MKVSATLIVLASQIESKPDKFRAPKGVDGSGNKINGQHPKRRLQALNKFMCNWAETYLTDGTSERFCERYTTMIHRLDQSFEREQCAFFDTSIKFGGPNPDTDMSGKVHAKNPNAKNPTKSRRLRREADEAEESDPCEGLSEHECDELLLDDGSMDCDGGDDVQKLGVLCETTDDKGDLKGKKGKMSTPNRKLKRYSTGLAKWCQRYIAECYGQRVHDHCIMRAKKFLTTLAIPDETN